MEILYVCGQCGLHKRVASAAETAEHWRTCVQGDVPVTVDLSEI